MEAQVGSLLKSKRIRKAMSISQLINTSSERWGSQPFCTPAESLMWFRRLVGVAGYEKTQSMSSCSTLTVHTIDENYSNQQERTGIEKFCRPGKDSEWKPDELWARDCWRGFLWQRNRQTKRRSEQGTKPRRRMRRREKRSWTGSKGKRKTHVPIRGTAIKGDLTRKERFRENIPGRYVK